MARRRNRPSQREVSTPSLTSVVVRRSPPAIVNQASPVADRRTYHPEGANRPPLSTGSRTVQFRLTDTRPKQIKRKSVQTRVIRGPGGKPMVSRKTVFTVKPLRVLKQTKAKLSFAAPGHVLVCLRRKIRKAVMVALKRRPGRGSRQRRNRYSEVKC